VLITQKQWVSHKTETAVNTPPTPTLRHTDVDITNHGSGASATNTQHTKFKQQLGRAANCAGRTVQLLRAAES